MELWRSIAQSIMDELSLFSWYDMTEILFFIIIMRYWLLWLNMDKEKNLSVFFCWYSVIIGVCYYAELTTISTLLLASSPLMIVIFIMLHQEHLQRNFITLTRPRSVSPTPANTWISEIMSFALGALHRQQELIFIIERHDNLSLLLTSPCIINASATKEFLELLVAQDTPSVTNLWLTHEGIIIGINTTMNYELEHAYLSSDVKHRVQWQQEGAFITKKSDAIIFGSSPITKTFTLIVQEKITEHISAQQTVVVLKQLIQDMKHKEGNCNAPTFSHHPHDNLHHQ